MPARRAEPAHSGHTERFLHIARAYWRGRRSASVAEPNPRRPRSGRAELVIRCDVHNGDITGIHRHHRHHRHHPAGVLDDNVVVAVAIMIGRLGEKVNTASALVPLVLSMTSSAGGAGARLGLGRRRRRLIPGHYQP